jgi:hypothetical protein
MPKLLVVGAVLLVSVLCGVAIVVILPRTSGSNGESSSPAVFIPKTADYYIAHREEMKARTKVCGNEGISPMGDSAQARDCNAAQEAERRIFFGS